MENEDQRWNKDFPITEEVEDFGGNKRAFFIECEEGPLGFFVRAREQSTEEGYEFGAYSETSPYSALGRVRHKMYRNLANPAHHQINRDGGWVPDAA